MRPPDFDLWPKEEQNLFDYLCNPDDAYLNVKRLKDGTFICMHDLLYTRAIMIDLCMFGWGKRFCFSDMAQAVAEFEKLESGDQEPVGFIARRGVGSD